jgi:protein tyrosine kinase modulator
MNEQSTSAISWRELVAVVGRRHKLIGAVLASGAITAALVAFVPAPSYDALSKLMVTSQRARMIVSPDPKAASQVDRVSDQDLNSEVEMLKSEDLIREVLEPYRNREAAVSGFWHWVSAATDFPVSFLENLYLWAHGVPLPTPFEKRVHSVAGRLHVTPVKMSNLIELDYQDTDPQWAADFVNALAAQHVKRRAQLDRQSDTRRFFAGQRQLLSDRLSQAETAMKHFYEREGIDSLPEQRTTMVARLTEVESALAHSETELAEGTARVEFLEREIRSHPRTVPVEAGTVPNDPLQLIKSRIVELELQRSALLSKFAPTSVNVSEVDRQIAEAHRLLTNEAKTEPLRGSAVNRTHEYLELNLAQTQAQMAAVKARVDDLRQQVAAQRSLLEHLDRARSEYERLQQDVSAAQEALQTYRTKEEQARFSDALDESKIVNVSIVEPAQVPAAPQASKRMTIFSLGAVMSLLASLSLAFVYDRIDPTVKDAAEARAVAGLPLLADLAA